MTGVDNPRPPPCVRCRRESKRCEFSATRRKRKQPNDDDDPLPDDVLRRDKRMMVADVSSTSASYYSPQYNASNSEWDYLESPDGRSRHNWSEAPPSTTGSDFSTTTTAAAQRYAQQPPTSSPQVQVQENPRRGLPPRIAVPPPTPHLSSGYEHHLHQHSQPMMNRTAIELLSPAISNSHDALHLLSEAAGRTEDLNRQIHRRSSRRLAAGPSSAAQLSLTPPAPRSSAFRSSYFEASSSSPMEDVPRSRTDSVAEPPGHADAVKVWSRLRFVRAGWLTVEEAMEYVAYYYEYLAPLSPIVIPDFSDPSTHRILLAEEPVLAVTILTTASRHMKPKGDGAYTRSFYIHDRLWSYLRGMIERVFWGQERFGSVSRPRSLDIFPPTASSSSLSSSSKGSLRSLGTVEALLVLTDWHPRNLHFPPGDDENSLLDLDVHALAANGGGGSGGRRGSTTTTTTTTSSSAADGRLAFQKWLEPAWRSDRMSWMLLSIAQALAFELGVFNQRQRTNNNSNVPSEQTRKRRLRRLILVYVTQSSGRLGIPSMLPLPQWGLDAPPHDDGESEDVDRMQDCWIGISKIMYQSNHILFATMEQTSELTRSGRYHEQIDRFVPYLKEFRQNLDRINRES